MKQTFDPNKLFLTEFMVIAILKANPISLEAEDIYRALDKTLNQPRAKRRINKAIVNLTERGVLQVTEFGNYCIAKEHNGILSI